MNWLYVPLALLLYNSTGYLTARRLFLNCVTSFDYEWKYANYAINGLCLVLSLVLTYSQAPSTTNLLGYAIVVGAFMLITRIATSRGRNNMLNVLLARWAPKEVLMRLVASKFPIMELMGIRIAISNRLLVPIQQLTISGPEFEEFLAESLDGRSDEERDSARRRFERAKDLLT